MMFTQRGYRLRAAAAMDDWDNPTEDWDNATRDRLYCVFQQYEANEELGETDTTTTRALLMLPAATDILATDRWEQYGVVYRVHGKPNHVRGLVTIDHIECVLVEVDTE